jgi:translation initiation factor eIF-2B subunit gamma
MAVISPSNHMQERLNTDVNRSSNQLEDVDGVNIVRFEDHIGPDPASENNRARSSSRSLNPRVQFLRLSAAVRGRSFGGGTLGAVPPYQPAPPSLSRSLDVEHYPADTRLKSRTPSPLRNVALASPLCSDESPSKDFIKRVQYSPFTSTHTQISYAKMPQTGFQALILCGPGIGLNTFTSVPAEFPKALVEIANRPMVWYALDWCYRMGINDITLITPPTSKAVIAAALAQNPYLTGLPSPSADLLAPEELEHTTPTAELLRLPQVQNIIKSDFVLLPCDIICNIPGEQFLDTYLTRIAGPGGIGANADNDVSRNQLISLGGEQRGRRGGLSIWYNTADREESVKGEECDFMCTTKLDQEHVYPISKPVPMPQPHGVLRKLVWTMPMSELLEQCEEDKSWKIRQSLLRKHGAIKCMTKYRDSHIYFFPYWVKEFARLNEDFESVSEDLVGTWAKAEWRKPTYRARFGARKMFTPEPPRQNGQIAHERPLEEEVDLLSLSSTQVALSAAWKIDQPVRTARLASRVTGASSPTEADALSPGEETQAIIQDVGPVPSIPPILSYILPSPSTTPIVRRVDTTPLLLSVSLSLAKLPSIEESLANKTAPSPFSHPVKVHATTTVSPRVTISRSDTLIDSNCNIATQCVIKNSVVGASVSIGTGSRITGCVIMAGVTIGEKCVLTNTVVGKKSKIENKCSLVNCEVQDGNVVPEETEGKGEKYQVGGFEDDDEVDD